MKHQWQYSYACSCYIGKVVNTYCYCCYLDNNIIWLLHVYQNKHTLGGTCCDLQAICFILHYFIVLGSLLWGVYLHNVWVAVSEAHHRSACKCLACFLQNYIIIHSHNNKRISEAHHRSACQCTRQSFVCHKCGSHWYWTVINTGQ